MLAAAAAVILRSVWIPPRPALVLWIKISSFRSLFEVGVERLRRRKIRQTNRFVPRTFFLLFPLLCISSAGAAETDSKLEKVRATIKIFPSTEQLLVPKVTWRVFKDEKRRMSVCAASLRAAAASRPGSEQGIGCDSGPSPRWSPELIHWFASFLRSAAAAAVAAPPAAPALPSSLCGS